MPQRQEKETWSPLIKRGAVFSDSGDHRFLLTRKWGEGRLCVFGLLNPSRASAHQEDATSRKCIGFAKRLGCDEMWIINLFSFCTTLPVNLRRARVPTLQERNEHYWCKAADQVRLMCGVMIAGWGVNGIYLGQDEKFLKCVGSRGNDIQALRLTKLGYPEHPLYIPYDTKPVPYRR